MSHLLQLMKNLNLVRWACLERHRALTHARSLSKPRPPCSFKLLFDFARTFMNKAVHLLSAALIVASSASAAPGDLVAAFGANGISATPHNAQNGECTVVTQLSDGRILSGSTIQTGATEYRVIVSRLDENGSLDTSFGTSGVVQLSGIAGATPQLASPVALLLRSDGRIAVAVAISGGAAVRVLSPEGVELPTLGFNYASLPSGRLNCAILGNQDRIFLGGAQRSHASASDDNGWLSQFHASGAINTSFGSFGKHTYGGSGNQGIHSLALSRDNILYVGGFNGNDAVLHRQNPTDGSFFWNSNSIAFRSTVVSSAYTARAIHLDSIGRPVVVASTMVPQGQPIVARFRLNFTLDTSFGNAGIALINSGGAGSYPQMERVIGTTLMDDDQLLVTGLVAESALQTTVGTRLISRNGVPDALFGGAGWATHVPLRHSALAPACPSLPVRNGKLLVPGWLAAVDPPTSRQAVAQVEAPLPKPIEALQVTAVADNFRVSNETSVTYAINATTSREGASLTYQWYSNSGLLSWWTNSQYTFALNYSNENNLISVLVSDGTDSIRHWFTGKVFEPPVIALSAGRVLRRPVNAQKSFSIPTSGRSPRLLRFFVGDLLERTVDVSTQEFSWNLGPSTELGSVPVRIVASNADGETTWEGTLETLPDPSVALNKQSMMVDVGTDFEFPAEAVTTATGMSFGLEKNGVDLSQPVTGGIPRLSALKLSDGGTYRVRLGTTIGLAFSPIFRLCVVDDAERQTLVAAGESVQLSARAAGPGLVYQWFRDGHLLSDSTSLTGSATATLQLSNVQSTALGDYACFVSNGDGTSKRAGRFSLRITQQPPSLSLLRLPPFRTGEFYHYQMPPELLIGAISIKNLPPGITLNPDGNILSGSPTRPGTHRLLITATNPSGSVRDFVYPLTVNGVPDHLRGLHIGDLSNAIPEGPFEKVELRVSDSGHFSAVFQFSTLRGNRKVFRKSGVFQHSTSSSGNTLTRAIWRLPQGARYPGENVLIRITENDRLSSTPFLGLSIEPIQASGQGEFYLPSRFTRAWSELPEGMMMPQGVYNLELPVLHGYQVLAAPSTSQLVFTKNRRALLRGRLGDRDSFVASPAWVENNGLYFSNLSNGSRSFTQGQLTYVKGNSPEDWDAEFTATIKKPRNFALPVRKPLPESYVMFWQGRGTRYLPPNTPFLSGPMPFNSRQANPVYSMIVGTVASPWANPSINPWGDDDSVGDLRPNFTGTGYSASQIRSIETEGYFLLPSTLKVNPRTGVLQGTFSAVNVVRVENDNGEFMRYRRTVSSYPYAGLVTRDKGSTISRGTGQTFTPYYVDYNYTDSNGNVRQSLVKTLGSQGVYLYVRGQ